jgi:hypothetical protein
VVCKYDLMLAPWLVVQVTSSYRIPLSSWWVNFNWENSWRKVKNQTDDGLFRNLTEFLTHCDTCRVLCAQPGNVCLLSWGPGVTKDLPVTFKPLANFFDILRRPTVNFLNDFIGIFSRFALDFISLNFNVTDCHIPGCRNNFCLLFSRQFDAVVCVGL